MRTSSTGRECRWSGARSRPRRDERDQGRGDRRAATEFGCRTGGERVVLEYLLRVQQLRVEYLQPAEPVDEQVDARQLGRRALIAVSLLGALALVAWLAPGLGQVRSKLNGADGAWLALGVVLEGLSCASYVVMFRPVFCDRMTWRSATEL